MTTSTTAAATAEALPARGASLASAVRAERLARRIGALAETVRAKQAGDLDVSAKALILDGAGRLLVLKDSRSNWHDLPGGHVQAHETEEEALRREVREETGLEVQ